MKSEFEVKYDDIKMLYKYGLITFVEAISALKDFCEKTGGEWDRGFEKHISYCLLRGA